MHMVIQMSINISGSMCLPVFVHVSMRRALTLVHMSVHTSVRMPTHMSIHVSVRMSAHGSEAGMLGIQDRPMVTATYRLL